MNDSIFPINEPINTDAWRNFSKDAIKLAAAPATQDLVNVLDNDNFFVGSDPIDPYVAATEDMYDLDKIKTAATNPPIVKLPSGKVLVGEEEIAAGSKDIVSLRTKGTVEPVKQEKESKTNVIYDDSWLEDAGLSFLSRKPQAPTQQIGFNTEIGLIITSFHNISLSENYIVLVYDMRYNEGSYFKLKQSDKTVTVVIDKIEYSVMITEFSINVGCLNLQFLLKE